MSSSSEAIDNARALLANAGRVAVLTGAGISAESGIPTFRGASGLWKQFRAEDLATPRAFARNPTLVWEWYDWRRSIIAVAEPNAGHRALAAMEQKHPTLTIITQNVDGLHARAGSHSIIEIHGSIWKLQCTECNKTWMDYTVPLATPPRCGCGGLARPGVVWFGEKLPTGAWEHAQQAAETCDVLLVAGTSLTCIGRRD